MKYCDNCSKTSDDFSDQSGFIKHKKSHAGQVECSHCGKKMNKLDLQFGNEKNVSKKFFKMLRELENSYYV